MGNEIGVKVVKLDINKTIREVVESLNIEDNSKEIEKLKTLEKDLVYDDRGRCPFCDCRPFWMPGILRKF